MKKQIRVLDRVEVVTILAIGDDGGYRVIWHRSETGPHEELYVTPDEGESVEQAVAKDLRARLGP